MVTTEHAKHFYNPEEVSVEIYSDKDEWEVTMTLLNVIVSHCCCHIIVNGVFLITYSIE